MSAHSRLATGPVRRSCVVLKLAATCLMAVPVLVSAQDPKSPCDVNKTMAEMKDKPQGLFASLAAPLSSSRCGSVLSVLKRVGSTNKVGGRKLEPDKALDMDKARAERASVASDPALASALTAELQGEKDPARRLLLEAAFLDEQGLYKARDLVLAQLMQSETAR